MPTGSKVSLLGGLILIVLTSVTIALASCAPPGGAQLPQSPPSIFDVPKQNASCVEYGNTTQYRLWECKFPDGTVCAVVGADVSCDFSDRQ